MAVRPEEQNIRLIKTQEVMISRLMVVIQDVQGCYRKILADCLFYFGFLDRVSLCSLGCPRTSYAGPGYTRTHEDLPASIS